MPLAMLCFFLAIPTGGLVTVAGLVRLARGDAEQYPALRWLAWVPALLACAAFLLG